MEEQDVRQAARAIRPYLSELLETEDEAAQMDEQLAELLLNAQVNQSIKVPLLRLLSSTDRSREWTRLFLKDKIPPQVYRSQRPAGDVISIAAQRWICPIGDYDWYPSTKGEPSPLCPTHNLELVPTP